MTAVIVLPFAPSTNQLWRANGRRVYRSKKYTDWMDECGYALQQQTPLPFFYEPVSISIKIGRPDKRRRDLDNFATKAVFDALVHYRILDDDSLVHRFTAEWDEGITGIQVEIEEIL